MNKVPLPLLGLGKGSVAVADGQGDQQCRSMGHEVRRILGVTSQHQLGIKGGFECAPETVMHTQRVC